MRNYFISLLLIVLALCGCKRAPAASQVASTQFVTTFGTNHDPVTGWTISVETNGIHIGPRTSSALAGLLKLESTVSPSGWKAHPGWFAFAESEERVWVFDGDSELLMLSATPKEVKITHHRSSEGIPTNVLVRLPESVRKGLKKGE